MYRYRVLGETEQLELMELAQERADLRMLEPPICGLRGVSGVDVREMLMSDRCGGPRRWFRWDSGHGGRACGKCS